MPQKIPREVKESVIGDWLSGKPRDTIAYDNMVSAGAVTYIIKELRNDPSVSDLDALRELGIMFRKLGISAPQCAIGFRIASILKNLGVDEDNFANFVSQIYNQCKDIGLQPEYIANTAKQILDLSGSTPLSQIPDYIQEKTKERRKLEEDIEKLKAKELDARTELMLTLDENKVTLAELEEFSPLKVELNKLGIFVEDIPRTIGIIQGVQKSGYNVDTITQLLSSWEASRAIHAQLEKKIEDLTDKKENLEEECDRLEELTSIHRQKESLFKQLKEMGFGLKELKLLFYTIKEVAAENKIPEILAVQKFFSDIEKDYDTKLGYDSTLEQRRSQIEKMDKKLSTRRNMYCSIYLLDFLFIGLDEKQILNLTWALQANARNLVLLEADLNKYGNLKNAIERLGQELKDLESQKKKHELNDVMVMQECAMVAPLIKAARGEAVEYNQLKCAIASALSLAIRRKALDDKEAARVLRNASDMIEAPKYSLFSYEHFLNGWMNRV
jgi:hypothetical protein